MPYRKKDYLEKSKDVFAVLILGILKRQSPQYFKVDIPNEKERDTRYWVPDTSMVPFNTQQPNITDKNRDFTRLNK